MANQNSNQQPPKPPEATTDATKINRPSSAGAKVTIACKLPHGLVLRIHKKTSERELVMGGGSREVEVFRPQPGARVVINGVRSKPFGMNTAFRVVGDFALTEGVDKDFWDAWCDQNADHDAVRNGLLFAYENQDHAVGKAREMADEKSGLEPLHPDGDPRASRSRNPNLEDVTEEEERKKNRGKVRA